MCEKYLHDRDGHAPLGRRYAAEDWDAKGLAVPTWGCETPPCASAQLLLEQRLVLPSWAVCQADGFYRLAVEDGLDLFDHGLHNFMAAGGDPIDGVGG